MNDCCHSPCVDDVPITSIITIRYSVRIVIIFYIISLIVYSNSVIIAFGCFEENVNFENEWYKCFYSKQLL